MKIVVLSDSHGNYHALSKVMTDVYADLYIHLGDGERELDRFCTACPDKQVYHIAGNCDFASLSPDELLISPDDKNVIYAVHGHLHGVKYSLDSLKQTARQKGANIILYGHTHCRYNKYEDGIYIMNPGSLSLPRDGQPPSFGVIELLSNGIITNITNV